VAKADTSVANLESGDNLASKAGSWVQRVKEYVEDLKAEMHKVTWPTWSQVRATTAVVIASVFAFAFYFAVVDVLITRILQRILTTFTK
jgi:preprotein translocase subunit SecE